VALGAVVEYAAYAAKKALPEGCALFAQTALSLLQLPIVAPSLPALEGSDALGLLRRGLLGWRHSFSLTNAATP